MARLALVVSLASALVVAGCGASQGGDRPETVSNTVLLGSDGPRLSRYGITLEVPRGWDATISHGAIRSANFPLASRVRGGPLQPGEIVLELFETDPGADSPPADISEYPELDAAPTLAADDFRPPEPGTMQVEGLARRTFSLSGRLFVLFAESGSRTPAAGELEALDRLLRSLRVEAGDFYPGSVEPPRFTARNGWDVGNSGPRPVRADADFLTAWAATVPYRDTWNSLPPQHTLTRLPADGVVVWVGLDRDNHFPPSASGSEGFPPVSPPFRLSQFERYAGWEGQVDDIPEYRLWATVHGQYRVDVRVYFGRPDPTPQMTSEVDAMLAGLRLPDWGPWELDRGS